MNKKITFVSFFIVILLMSSPVTQSIGENTTKKVKNDLNKIILEVKIQDELKNKIIEKLEKIKNFDDKTLDSINRFKNILEKSNSFGFNNFWLNWAFIQFLWSLYYIIDGDQTAARYHLQRAVFYLILYVMTSN